jgi:lysophospholipid acyltransferase (LPLAT)-like uncharacterized protein
VLFKKDTHATGIKWRAIGMAGKLLIDFLFLFSRLERQSYSSVADLIACRRFIFAFWHSRILLLSYVYKRLNASIMVSNSADGEVIAQVLQRHGHHTIRGSTGKGGLRALMRQINDIRANERPGVVIPDGPQGPRHKVQTGIILLAQKTGCPIVPLTCSSQKRKVFNSWDRFILPFPWTRGLVVYGSPIEVPADADAAMIDACAQRLERELNRITAQADAYYGHEFER